MLAATISVEEQERMLGISQWTLSQIAVVTTLLPICDLGMTKKCRMAAGLWSLNTMNSES